MSTQRWVTTITEKGIQLMARAPNHKFIFTRSEAGDGTAPIDELEKQVSLVNYKKSLLITSIESDIDKVNLRLQLNNNDLANSFYLRQIGVFAKIEGDDNDVLVIIMQTEIADFIPSKMQSPNFASDYIINTIISNTEKIDAIIDPAAFVTVGQFEDIMKKIAKLSPEFNIGSITHEAIPYPICQAYVLQNGFGMGGFGSGDFGGGNMISEPCKIEIISDTELNLTTVSKFAGTKIVTQINKNTLLITFSDDNKSLILILK